MRPILLEAFLLQLFYPHPPQMSFYYAVCPWYGHHLPKLEASTKREKSMICRMNFNQGHSQTTSLAYISASEEVLQKNFHHMFSWKMDLRYLKNGMVWMVYSHFLHKRSQSKLYNSNTDVKTKSHFSKIYERKK